MKSPPIKGFYDGPASQAADEAAREGIPIAGFDLMRRAAQEALRVIVAEYPEANKLLVICGKGNNGGDGYLVASLAAAQGIAATVVSIFEPSELSGDAVLAYEEVCKLGIACLENMDELDLDAFDVVVDAMLGTGFRDEARPSFAEAITKINESKSPVVAIDLPSGVNASTGASSHGVQSDHTVTFITQKIGTSTGPGRSLAGRVHYCDLAVPGHLLPTPFASPCHWYGGALPHPGTNAYKHQMGHVLIAGGDLGMPGAVAMAAEAALRVGAGMVTIATRVEHADAMLARIPEAMTLDPEADDFVDRLSSFDVVVLGPGLGRKSWGLGLYQNVEASKVPVVLDADGLFLLAQNKHWHGGQLAMTPHSAEAARLLDGSVSQIEADRFSSAQALGEQYQARINLKGPGSVLRLQSRLEICVYGKPGMATAGMGDVLSGIVGGVLAGAYRSTATEDEKDQLFSAAVALHSKAADHAASQVGMRSLVATDVIRALPTTMLADV